MLAGNEFRSFFDFGVAIGYDEVKDNLFRSSRIYQTIGMNYSAFCTVHSTACMFYNKSV